MSLFLCFVRAPFKPALLNWMPLDNIVKKKKKIEKMLFGCVITYDRRFRLNGGNRVFVNQVSWRTRIFFKHEKIKRRKRCKGMKQISPIRGQHAWTSALTRERFREFRFGSTGIKLCNQEVIKRVKKASRSYKKSKKKRGNNEENQCTKKYINKRKTKESK